MKALFAAIPAWVYVVAAILIIVALVVILVLVIRARRARVPRVPEGVEDMPGKVREVFAAAEGALRTRASDRLAAWVAGPTQPARDTGRRLLVVGAAGAGKTTMLRQLARETTFAPTPNAVSASPCNLFRLEGAIAVDVAGRVLRDEDGKGQGGEAFQAVLTELKKAFPDRPVDGIVLAVPMSPLLTDEAGREKLAEDARRMRKRIDEVQRGLAMRVPVYLVVTQCDGLPSFTALGREVGEPRRQRILGWSRPERDNEDPAADWVDEAIASVGDALSDEQQRRFAAEPLVSDPSNYFLFPADLATCEDALRAFVDPIFHEKASGDPPDLRGIYFTGRSAPLPPPLPVVAGVPALEVPPPPVLFAWELFTRKIMPESNLAQPSPEAEKRRVRTIRVLQVVSVIIGLVWGAFLAFAWTSLERRTATVLPFLEHLNSDLVHITAGERNTGKYASGLLDMLAGMNSDRLRTYAAPTSLASPIDTRVREAVALGYDQVVFAAFRQTIEDAGAVRPGDLPPADAPELENTAALERTHEFERADEWLHRLEAFTADVERYNQIVDAHEKRIASEREIQAIADLSDSLFRHKLNQTFFSNAKYYTDAINEPMDGALRFDVRALAPQAQADALDVFRSLHKRIYALSSGPVVPDDLEELLTSFRELEDPSPEYTTKQMRRLQRAIKSMEEHVGRDGLKWVPNDQVPAAPEKQEGLYKRVEALRVLLGPDVSGQLRDDAKRKLLELQNKLRAARDPLLGPVLSRKQGGERLEMKLAGDILSLSEPIDSILRQPYMTGSEDTTGQREVPVAISIPAETQVEWDVDTLKGVAKILKDYETMLTDGPFDKFPRTLQGKVRDLAQRRVQVWLHALFNNNRAARKNGTMGAGPVPYHVLQADGQNFALAGAPLREIIAELGRARVDESRDQVRALTRAQGGRVLRALNRSLDAENLYHGSFSWWNGDGTPAYRAFQVNDAAALAEHVVDQRTRAETLSRDVGAPVLAVLVSPEVGAQDVNEVTRWDRIVGALRDYEAKKAGNSVTALERFILTDLPAITDLDKCLALEKTTARGRDFFGERRRILFERLRERCLSISRDDLRDWYERLRLEFNRSLADRFPFSKNERAEDATPEAVRSFLLSASDFRKRYRGVLSERKDSSSKDLVRFLDKVEEANLFLAPLWAQTESGDGAMDARVEFRVNAARELAGNEIADWSFRVAEERLVLGGTKLTTRWHIDDPVRVQLRWAKNSPDMPSSSQAARVAVVDRLVTFEERGLWALLRMIAGHQTTLRDNESRAEGSTLLVFNVRTIPDPQGGFVDRVGIDSGTARVFIRLTLTSTAKDKTAALRYPDFPTRAPVYFEAIDKSAR
ncbi:IcmF-related protein [Minicystis rosea]|nr:IcmF-related protein [Minicystis rosea]